MLPRRVWLFWRCLTLKAIGQGRGRAILLQARVSRRCCRPLAGCDRRVTLAPELHKLSQQRLSHP